MSPISYAVIADLVDLLGALPSCGVPGITIWGKMARQEPPWTGHTWRRQSSGRRQRDHRITGRRSVYRVRFVQEQG